MGWSCSETPPFPLCLQCLRGGAAALHAQHSQAPAGAADGQQVLHARPPAGPPARPQPPHGGQHPHRQVGGGPGPTTPPPPLRGPGPCSQLTPCCLLQGPTEDARVRAEYQRWRQEWDLGGGVGVFPCVPRGVSASPGGVSCSSPHLHPSSAPQVPQIQHPDLEQQNRPGWGQPPGGVGLRLPVPRMHPPPCIGSFPPGTPTCAHHVPTPTRLPAPL